MNRFFFFSLMIFLAVTQQSNAQKFGHINSALIIQNHPLISTANTALESFQKSLLDPFDVQAKAFEVKYRAFVEEANNGTLSQVATQNKQVALQTEQDSLATLEQQIKFSVMQKRELLLQPILTQVDSVIQLIGKEGSYTMIFDTSVSGALLFAEDSNDLTEAVKARLKK
ncbi:MAG TPA: OmpH family outer membrane protein [Saprospiraceae bacterium]|nr:OmpH family outer membrane protein [Saprospiraceae bacterium]